MTTYTQINRHEFLRRHMIDEDDIIVKSLMQLSTLKETQIKNIVTYAKSLQKIRSNSANIDEVVFKAQMVDRFDLKQEPVLTRIFDAACNSRLQNFKPFGMLKPKRKKKTILTLHNYCYLICIFLSDSLETKIDFVFDVFDENRADEISTRSLHRLVGHSVDFAMVSHHDDDKLNAREDYVRDLVAVLLTKFDRNADGLIDRSEFHAAIGTDEFMIDCLGQVFPDRTAIAKFKALIFGKLPLEVKAFFRFERRRSLQSIDIRSDIFTELYPIPLEPWL